MNRVLIRSLAMVGMLALPWLASPALGGGNVVAWGYTGFGLSAPCVSNVVAIATGYEQSIFLKEDGTVANCGMHWWPDYPYNIYDHPITVPAGLSDVVAVAGGYAHSLALKADGTVVAWGLNTSGQTNVPPTATNVVAISASAQHNLALRADGTVIGWGSLPGSIPTGLSNVIAIAAGSGDLALKADGTVVSWGFPYAYMTNAIAGLSNVVAISSGYWGYGNGWLALKADGTVQGNSALSNIVAIADSSGTDHHIALAIKSDGKVVGWGFDFYGYGTGKPMVPVGLSNVVAVSSDSSHCLALVGGGRPFLVNRLINRTAVMSGNTIFRIEATGDWPFSYQWRHEGTNLPGATNAVLALSDLQPNEAGNYSVAVTNAFGEVTSESALLALSPLNITSQPQSQTNFAGGTTELGVVVQGIEPLSYQWLLNGTPLTGRTDRTLVLSDLQFDQVGEYSVAVSNTFGTMVSLDATLTVVPALISEHPHDQVAFHGGAVSFNVAAQGIEPISFQWQFDDAELPGETNSSLHLTWLRQTQMGNYSVTLSNAAGVVKSHDAFLSVVKVAAWGSLGQASVPTNLTNVFGVAAGMFHQLTLKADGTVVAWGGDHPSLTNMPPGLTSVVAIGSGCYAPGSLALKDDGRIVMWGYNSYGWQQNLAVAEGLTNVVATAGGQSHMLALKEDGTVVAWGSNSSGQTNLADGLTDAVAIAAGQDHSLVLRADGTVRASGDNTEGQSTVPLGLSNVVAIAAGAEHSLALLGDGTVRVWGGSAFYGQANVPAGLSNVIAIAAGEFHSLALKVDGTLVAWGHNFLGETNVPFDLRNVTAIAAGGRQSMALVGDGPPVLQVPLSNPTTGSNGFSVSLPTQSGRLYRLEYKESLSDTNWKALPLVAGNGRTRNLTDPTVTGGQRFYRVRQW